MDEKEFKLRVKTLLDEYSNTFTGNGAFCTTWFLTAEFFDGDGQYWSATSYEPESPIWRVTGLVDHARSNDITNEEEEDED